MASNMNRDLTDVTQAPAFSPAVESPQKIVVPHFLSVVKTDTEPYYYDSYLGKGSCGHVWIIVRARDKKAFAVKIKEDPTPEAVKEVSNLESLSHFGCLMIVETHWHEKYFFIVTEFCSAGSLHYQIGQRKLAHMRRNIGYLAVQLISALQYLHTKQKLLHRDIKPENVFVYINGLIKVGDFGLSNVYEVLSQDAGGRTICGTPEYLAPELCLGKTYGHAADMWSLGVLLYECVTGRRPFSADSHQALFRSIVDDPVPPIHLEVESSERSVKGGNWTVEDEFGACNGEIIDIIYRLLKKNPKERPTSTELLSSPYMMELARRLPGTLRNNSKNKEELDMVDRVERDLEEQMQHLNPPMDCFCASNTMRSCGVTPCGSAVSQRNSSEVIGMDESSASSHPSVPLPAAFFECAVKYVILPESSSPDARSSSPPGRTNGSCILRVKGSILVIEERCGEAMSSSSIPVSAAAHAVNKEIVNDVRAVDSSEEMGERAPMLEKGQARRGTRLPKDIDCDTGSLFQVSDEGGSEVVKGARTNATIETTSGRNTSFKRNRLPPLNTDSKGHTLASTSSSSAALALCGDEKEVPSPSHSPPSLPPLSPGRFKPSILAQRKMCSEAPSGSDNSSYSYSVSSPVIMALPERFSLSKGKETAASVSAHQQPSSIAPPYPNEGWTSRLCSPVSPQTGFSSAVLFSGRRSQTFDLCTSAEKPQQANSPEMDLVQDSNGGEGPSSARNILADAGVCERYADHKDDEGEPDHGAASLLESADPPGGGPLLFGVSPPLPPTGRPIRAPFPRVQYSTGDDRDGHNLMGQPQGASSSVSTAPFERWNKKYKHVSTVKVESVRDSEMKLLIEGQEHCFVFPAAKECAEAIKTAQRNVSQTSSSHNKSISTMANSSASMTGSILHQCSEQIPNPVFPSQTTLVYPRNSNNNSTPRTLGILRSEQRTPTAQSPHSIIISIPNYVFQTQPIAPPPICHGHQNPPPSYDSLVRVAPCRTSQAPNSPPPLGALHHPTFSRRH